MRNDSEYREQELQRRKVKRDQKRKEIEENHSHVDARKDADRMAKVRKVAREAQEATNTQEQEDIIEKVRQRYYSYNFLYLMCFRIAELDAHFTDLQVKEQQWPMPGPDVTPMYKKYLTHTYKLGQNIVCAYCGCIFHDITKFEVVPQSYEPLRQLRIPEDVNIPFDFSCDINVLDQNTFSLINWGLHKTNVFFYVRYVTTSSPRTVSHPKHLRISNGLDLFQKNSKI